MSHSTEENGLLCSSNCAEIEAMLDFVLTHGLPMSRDGQYRYHGVSEPIWYDSPRAAIKAAIEDFQMQQARGQDKLISTAINANTALQLTMRSSAP